MRYRYLMLLYDILCRLSASLFHFILQIFITLPVLIAMTYVVLIQGCFFFLFLIWRCILCIPSWHSVDLQQVWWELQEMGLVWVGCSGCTTR